MVANFVGYYIGLRKLAGCAKTVSQFVIKRKVYINLAVLRTIERAGCRGSKATARIYLAGKKV